MQPDELVTEVNRIFGEEDASILIAAIRQDDLVWNALQDPLLDNKLVSCPQPEFSQWTPAAIFCLTAALPSPEDLKNLSLSVDGNMRQTSILHYEKIAREGNSPKDLSQAGFAALALRERRKLLKGWDNLADEIQLTENKTDNFTLQQWRTVISVLAGIIPDQETLFNELLGLSGKIGRDLVSHAILSTPCKQKERVNILAGLMIGMDLASQIDWMQAFALRGERQLSEQLAKLLIANTTSGLLSGFLSTELSILDMPQVAAKIARLQQVATLFQLAGKEVEANRYLNSATDTLSYLSAGIRLQQSGIQPIQQSEEDKFNAGRESEDINDFSGLNGELILAAASGGNKSIKGLPGKLSRSFQELRESAKLAASGEIEHAREMAKPAIDAFLRFIENSSDGYRPKFLINWQPEEFVELLINLNYLKEAASAAEWFLRYQPTNARLLGLVGDLFNRNAQPEQAAKSLALAVSLKPTNTNNRRLLAKLYETNGQYEKAFDERKRILELNENPPVDDQISLAKTALLAGKHDHAFETCRVIIENDPFNGVAACVVGQAAAAKGDAEMASEYLQKSTLLAPDYADGWLALSKFQKQSGDLQKAYETLRSASFSLPDSSKINLELALLSMETGRPSEALPHLRLAANLQPENLDVATMLSNALLTLGHKDEAVNLLGEIRKRWPEEVDLARTHGLLLQAQGKYPDAVEALKTVVRNDNSDEEAVTSLCLSLLESKLDSLVIGGKSKPDANLAEAAQIVSTLLTKQPQSVYGHLLLGSLQYAMGNLDDAFEEFKSAVEISANVDTHLHWIAQGGLGRAALGLNRPEVALAVLDEAAGEQQKNVTLQKLLVPAYMKANLPQEALITAQHAVELAPEDIETLVWYAHTMLEFGNKDEAVKSIRKASDALNFDAISLINLASLAVELNELPSARKALMELNTLPTINADELEKAARIQVQLGDLSTASENMQRAIKQSNSSNPHWLFELASLQKALGDSSTALETTRQAVGLDPLSIENWLVQADLYEEQGRHQSSLESLEKAVSLTNKKSVTENLDVSSENIPLFAKYRGINAAEIHARFSRLMVQSGNLTGALVHAEQSLEYEPQNLIYRLQAARLAESLLLSDRAELIAEIPVDHAQNLSMEDADPEDIETAAELLAIKASKKLSNNNISDVVRLYQEIRRLAPTSFAAENIDIRLAAAQGLLNEVSDRIDNHVVQYLLDNRKSKPDMSLSGMSIAAIDAALAVERWDLAIKLAAQVTLNHPHEPAAHLAFARVVVRSAEEFTLRKELAIQTHLPSTTILESDLFEKYESEMLAAAKQSNSVEVARWQKRGLLVFGGKSALEKLSSADFSTSEDFSVYLQSLRLAGKFDEAIGIGEKIEESPPVLLQMALVYIEKNPRIGLDLCQHASESVALSPVGLAISAKLAEACEETGLAIDYLNEALQIYTDEPLWRSWISKLLTNQKDFDMAAYHLEEAVALQPDSYKNWESLGNLYIRNKQNNQAVHAFITASELNSENPDLLLSLASAYRASGEIQEALDCINKAMELNVKPEKALLLRGEISRDLGNLNDAVDFSKKSLKANPNSQEAYLFLAQTLRIAGKANEAVATIDSAINTLGANLELLIEKAKILHSFRGGRDALPFLQGLAAQFPKNDEILNMLAKVQAELGDLQSAERTALESLKIQPRQPDLNTFVGKILRKTGQLDKAAHHFSQAVEQSKMDLEPVIELAQTHQDQRSYEKALEAFQLAIQIAPRDIRAYLGAAAIYRESKDYTFAEEMLRRAAEIEPSNITIRRQLGAVVALNLVHSSQEAKTLI
jgi:tetratricopeptide (TPR) repeat protein